MNADFSTIHNHHEQAVFQAVLEHAPRHPVVGDDPSLLADVACVALNRLAPRYIRHHVDHAFYLGDLERQQVAAQVDEAVARAFDFVVARRAMRARG